MPAPCAWLLIGLCLFSSFGFAHTKQTDPCGRIRILTHFDAGQPLLETFPERLRNAILKAIASDVEKELKLDVVIDAPPLTKALRVVDVTQTTPGHRLLLIWCDLEEISGNKPRPPVWLVEAGESEAHNLLRPNETTNNTVGGEWGFSVRPRPDSLYPDLTFVVGSGDVDCWHNSRNGYVHVPCAPLCARLINDGKGYLLGSDSKE